MFYLNNNDPVPTTMQQTSSRDVVACFTLDLSMVIMMFNNVELSLLVDTLLKPVIVLQAGFGLGQCCTLLSTIMLFLPTLSQSVI